MTVLGRVGRASAVALWVDPTVHAAEGRPVSQQDRGRTGDRDCSIWMGSIGAEWLGLIFHYPCGHGIVHAAQPVCAGVGRRILLWVRTYSRCMNATTRSLGGSSVLRRLRAVAHDAGDKRASGTMLSPNNGEITPTGN